jgi:predicted Zn-dependent protease
MHDALHERFARVAPEVEYWSLRVVDEHQEMLSVRRGVVQPATTGRDLGAMVTVIDAGGLGYAATCDLTESGLRAAGERASQWARATADRAVTRFAPPSHGARTGEYETPVRLAWNSLPLAEKLDGLKAQCERLHPDARIVDWEATLWWSEVDTQLSAKDGTKLHQRFRYLVPMMSASANEGTETLTRTFGGHGFARQGGLEVLDDLGFHDAAPRIAEQALALLSAPDCPSERCDLLLAPDQMILQIHESIGHPLELDRILGDERNYAGTSFVTRDMFGSYQYGSELLNIRYDPTRSEQLASFGWDDEGERAEPETLIRNGLLVRPLGGATSQLRTRADEEPELAGVACARAESWNRPPIDRMANLNLEAGDSSFEELVSRVEHGIYMETNCSWSIDDARNKFQFGCEWGRRIENGELGEVVKKPNYRGLSATFWRSLAGVGDAQSVAVLGTPFCGKGEPNQVIRVGHASPPCLFEDVDVFGGE